MLTWAQIPAPQYPIPEMKKNRWTEPILNNAINRVRRGLTLELLARQSILALRITMHIMKSSGLLQSNVLLVSKSTNVKSKKTKPQASTGSQIFPMWYISDSVMTTASGETWWNNEHLSDAWHDSTDDLGHPITLMLPAESRYAKMLSLQSTRWIEQSGQVGSWTKAFLASARR